MVVLDTHAWLWWIADPGRLSASARRLIDRADRIGVCTISCWEVATLVRRGRIELDRDLDAWVIQALGIERVVPIDLTSATAVAAGALGEDFPGDPADRIIYATAKDRQARLVTRDRALRRFDPEITAW
jgi:PIN domain nuclease of toxin-antitoxin system